MGNTKLVTKIGRVDQVMQTLPSDADAWGGAELDGTSAPVKSSSDSIQSHKTLSSLSRSISLPGSLSKWKKGNCHGADAPWLGLGGGEMPAGKPDILERGEGAHLADSRMGQCQQFKPRNLHAPGGRNYIGHYVGGHACASPSTPQVQIRKGKSPLHQQVHCRSMCSPSLTSVFNSPPKDSSTNLLGDSNRILMTGGSGFISGAVVRRVVRNCETPVCSLDNRIYASDVTSCGQLAQAIDKHGESRCRLLQVELASALAQVVQQTHPDQVLQESAEYHVLCPMEGQGAFIESYITGTFNLMQSAQSHWNSLPVIRRDLFGSLHDPHQECVQITERNGGQLVDHPLRTPEPLLAKQGRQRLTCSQRGYIGSAPRMQEQPWPPKNSLGPVSSLWRREEVSKPDVCRRPRGCTPTENHQWAPGANFLPESPWVAQKQTGGGGDQPGAWQNTDHRHIPVQGNDP